MWLALLSLLLSGCAVTDVHRTDPLNREVAWALLPIANHSETPLAGQKAEASLITLLHQRGISSLAQAPRTTPMGLLELPSDQDYHTALAWAQQQGVRYGVTGSVDEWQYKAGLDGEPAIGISLRVVDVNSGDILWSASGARSGWGFSTTSGVAQKLMSDLVDTLPVQ
jgi:curli biogenesis system outer membrane secretion channel CsgG